MSLTHRERIYAAIFEPSNIDRPPVALWRHFPVDDQDPGSLSASTVFYQNLYDWDLVKVTPASSFCLKDWGATDIWDGNPEGSRRFTDYVIKSPRDWEKLQALDPRKSQHLSDQLRCLQLIRSSLPTDTPIIQTVFSPLAQAKNLVGKSNLFTHINKYPEAVEAGLKVISTTTQRFVEILGEMGIDGIFYAIQHAQKSEMPLETYMEFGYKFDQVALSHAGEFWCNILHLHGENIYFDISKMYTPAFQIVNWHDRETSPSLSEGKMGFPGCVCGGINQKTLVFNGPDQVRHELTDALAHMSNNHLILGTGCVVPIIAPFGNILATRKAVDNLP